MFARAAGREVIDDGLEVFEHARAVRPEVGTVRLLLARRQHRHGCLVGMQHAVTKHLVLECVHQGLQLHAAGSDPLGQRGARQRHASPGEDALLPVQRHVIGILGHENLSQQARGGDALVDHLRGNRCLNQGLATGAGPLAADVALDREHTRRVVELLAHVLADALERAAAGTGR